MLLFLRALWRILTCHDCRVEVAATTKSSSKTRTPSSLPSLRSSGGSGTGPATVPSTGRSTEGRYTFEESPLVKLYRAGGKLQFTEVNLE